ncbi:hypothetical protein [Nonomuraea sp. NPDC049309]|uniref:hypothetical protein n=1 Tax=Nonomuraea sp. NPDC049309 TaxID=3364350 RepID=UPI003710A249
MRTLAIYGTPLMSSVRDLVARAPAPHFLGIGRQDRLTGLDALGHTGITSLTFFRVPCLAGLSPLAACRTLRFLQLAETPVEDLSPLAEPPELRTLWLVECPPGLGRRCT